MVGNHAGSQVYAQLRAAALEARRAADAAEGAAAQARSRIDGVTAERLQAVQKLASAELPELSAEAAKAAWPDAVPELLQFERQRQLRAAELQRELEDAGKGKQLADEHLRQATTALDAVVERREVLAAKAAAILAADSGYVQKLEATAQVEVALARDLDRAEEIAAEAKEKLPPYRGSRLFQYLWLRKFGTPEHAARGFAARMDRRLADHIGYGRAAASYRYLTATPQIVQLEVARRTEQVKAMRAGLDAREDEVEASVGLPPVIAEGAELGARRETALQEVAEAQRRIAATHAAMRTEAGNRGQFHDAAQRRLGEFLARAETAALERRALATPDPGDDVLVGRIRASTIELQRVAADAPALEAEARRLDCIADGLEDLLVRFQRQEFDSGRSYFTAVDPSRLIRDTQDGQIGFEDLWDQLRASHRFRETQILSSSANTASVLHGVGFALRIAGAVADIALSSRGARSRGGFGGGFSSGPSFGGGGGGFSSGRGLGGGGFTSGKGF